jgi:exopolysaccharide biosynthesis protein
MMNKSNDYNSIGLDGGGSSGMDGFPSGTS